MKRFSVLFNSRARCMAISMFGIAIALAVTSALLPISAYAGASCGYNELVCLSGQCTADNGSVCNNGYWQTGTGVCPNNDCTPTNCVGGYGCQVNGE